MERSNGLRRAPIAWIAAAALLCGLAGSGATAWALILTLDAPPVLSISDEASSFTLTFPGFLRGTVSDAHTVVYRIQANNLVAGGAPAAVSARMEEAIEGVDLEADISGYQNLGGGNFARLEEAQPGYKAVGTDQAALVSKTPGSGGGDAMLDGTLTVTWRARLTQDAPAGQQMRFLRVTLREGS